MKHKLYFGVFNKEGKCLFTLGNPFTGTFDFAEFMYNLVFSKAEPVLEPGHYIAYDFFLK